MSRQSETLSRALEALDMICQSPSAIAPKREPTLPVIDPFAWAEDFHKWTLAQCAYHDRCFGAVRGLHRDFCEWLIEHDEVPCTFDTFERLLQQVGFLIADGFVSGLVLQRTLAGLESFPAPTPQTPGSPTKSLCTRLARLLGSVAYTPNRRSATPKFGVSRPTWEAPRSCRIHEFLVARVGLYSAPPSVTPTPVAPSLAASEAPAVQGNAATVTIERTTANAEVYLDGVFVGNTPAILRVSSGDHVVRLTEGKDACERTLAVSDGADLRLRPAF
jgi:hypothetical protein